jgi:hypothetical protein
LSGYAVEFAPIYRLPASPAGVVHSTLNTFFAPPLKLTTFVNFCKPPSERLVGEETPKRGAETLGEKCVMKRVKRG